MGAGREHGGAEKSAGTRVAGAAKKEGMPESSPQWP